MADTILSQGAQQQQQQGAPPAQTPPPASSGSFRDYIADDGKFVDGWTEKLPDSHKPYAATLGKFPSPLDMAASYANLEKKLGEKIQPPGPDAKPEDWAKWRQLVGSPETPEGYELKKPEKLPEGVEWSDEEAGKLAGIAHKYGLPKAAVAEIIGMSLERESGRATKAKEGMAGYVAAQEKALKESWGDKFNDNIQAAVKAGQKLGVDMSDPDIGSNAKIIQVLHKASLLMREDQMFGGVNGSQKSTAEQIAEIRSSPAYQGKQGPEAQLAAAKRIELLSGVKA